MCNNEIWKPINDYPNYQISNFGNVKSLKFSKEKILKHRKDKDGYSYVGLYKNGKQKNYYVHRLVSEHFIDNPDNLPQIDHINTDRTDNRVENLRWVTHKENINNPLTIDKFNKPIIQFSKDNQFIRKWDNAVIAEQELGINRSNICNCCKGKRETAGNYKWRYAN